MRDRFFNVKSSAAQLEAMDGDFSHFLDSALSSMRKVLRTDEQVDMVILPEASLQEDDVSILESHLGKQHVDYYIAGVHCYKEDDLGENFARIGWRPSIESGAPWRFVQQHKHHRWAIDSHQVSAYQLHGQLNVRPEELLWEAINLHPRKLHLATIGGTLISALICEDLARQDPIGELLRSVGPSLVVALLADGAQLRYRWSARYATVLAEDPGSAVLTLTCKGMVDLWSSRRRRDGMVVALWQDPATGAHELELAPDSLGLGLRLAIEPRNEVTADGRKVQKPAVSLRSVFQLPSNR